MGGRSTRLWGQDAAQFKPERWLAMDTPPDAYTYPVFHAGPRECLGKRLAMVEMKAFLLTVLREVKLTLAVPPEAIRPDLQLTIGMSSGLPCHVAPRLADERGRAGRSPCSCCSVHSRSLSAT